MDGRSQVLAPLQLVEFAARCLLRPHPADARRTVLWQQLAQPCRWAAGVLPVRRSPLSGLQLGCGIERSLLRVLPRRRAILARPLQCIGHRAAAVQWAVGCRRQGGGVQLLLLAAMGHGLRNGAVAAAAAAAQAHLSAATGWVHLHLRLANALCVCRRGVQP